MGKKVKVFVFLVVLSMIVLVFYLIYREYCYYRLRNSNIVDGVFKVLFSSDTISRNELGHK